MRKSVFYFAFVGLMLAAMVRCSFAAEPWQLIETRYCGTPERNADGSIKRSTAVINAFKKIHPCPSTGLTTGACPGWAIDHVIPLAACACDAVNNLQWLKNEIKSCAGEFCKDRWERKINHCPVSADSPIVSGLSLPQSETLIAPTSPMPLQ